MLQVQLATGQLHQIHTSFWVVTRALSGFGVRLGNLGLDCLGLSFGVFDSAFVQLLHVDVVTGQTCKLLLGFDMQIVHVEVAYRLIEMKSFQALRVHQI